MDIKKFLMAGIISGIVIAIVSFLFNFLVNLAFPYNALALGGIRNISDPLMILFFLHYWVYGFTLTCAYRYFEPVVKGDFLQKGRKFGLLMWCVVSVPTAFVVFTSMDYPIGFTINQIIGSLVYMIAAGITIALVHR